MLGAILNVKAVATTAWRNISDTEALAAELQRYEGRLERSLPALFPTLRNGESSWTKSVIHSNGCQDLWRAVLLTVPRTKSCSSWLSQDLSNSFWADWVYNTWVTPSSPLLFFSYLTVGNSSHPLVYWDSLYLRECCWSLKWDSPGLNNAFLRPVRLYLEYMRVSLIWNMNGHWLNRIFICIWSVCFASFAMSLCAMVMF